LRKLIDSLLENPEAIVSSPKEQPEINAMLRKVDAREKELQREEKALIESCSLIALYGENLSEEGKQLQDKANELIHQQQMLYVSQQNKIKQLDEAISLQEKMREAKQPKIEAPALAPLPLEAPTSQFGDEAILPKVSTAPMPPPPPPPAPPASNRSKIKINPIQIREDSLPDAKKSEKKQPKNETLSRLANLFADPKFEARRKKMEQQELTETASKAQEQKSVQVSLLTTKPSPSANNLEKILQILAKTKPKLDLKQAAPILAQWQQQIDSLAKGQANLEAQTDPFLDLNPVPTLLLSTNPKSLSITDKGEEMLPPLRCSPRLSQRKSTLF
jgi:anion-transporting  ArsA/GET3 family ATPase